MTQPTGAEELFSCGLEFGKVGGESRWLESMHQPSCYDFMESNVLSRRNDVFGDGSPLFYSQPLHIIKGEGVTLYDADGRKFIDMYNNVPCVGHSHPHVVDAIQKQAAELNVHSRYLHESIIEYGERLLAKHAEKIECVVFSCTGTEANEIALQMAKVATGGVGFVCTDAAYHGNSTEVRKLVRPSSNEGLFRSIPFPETYRCNASDPLAYFLDCVRSSIQSFADDNVPFAGMVVCPILANEGLPNIPSTFMDKAAEIVHEAGGLMIVDEVQSGLCRTGEWWGYEKEGFEPDIVSMGKPLGAGVPLSATASSREIVEDFRKRTRYFNTFASSPLQAAAGNAVLDVLENEDLRSRSAEVGNWMSNQLHSLLSGHPSVGEIRSKGLFIAIEWVKDVESKDPDRVGAREMVERLKREGFLIGAAGKFGNVLKIRPPLVFNREHAQDFLDAVAKII